MPSVSEISITRRDLASWSRFIRSQAHVLSREPQLLLQQALNRPDKDTVGAAAQRWFQERGSPSPIVRWINKPQATDAVLLTLNTEKGRRCRFSPNDFQLLTWAGGPTSDPNEVSLWDAESGRLIGRWTNARVADQPFAIVDADKYGFGLLREGTVCLYECESGAELRTLTKSASDARIFSVSDGGDKLALGYEDGRLRMIDTATGTESVELPAHTSPIRTCAFLLGGRRLITGDESAVRLFDVESGTMLVELPDRDGWTYEHFEVSSNERWLVLEEKNVAEGRGWTTLWETETGRPGLQVTGAGHAIRTWGISPEGDRVLAIDFERGEVTRAILELWGVASNIIEFRFPLGWLSPYPPARFSPDGRWLAAGRAQPLEPGDLEIWDLHSRSEERAAHFKGHSAFVCDLAFSADGRALASIDANGELRLWALPLEFEKIQIRESYRHPNEVEACVFTPDGRTILTSCSEVHGSHHEDENASVTKYVTINPGEICLWDAESGVLLQKVEAGQQQPSHISFSPDAKHIAVSSRRFGGEAIKIWDRERMVPEIELGGHRSSVESCAYTTDGRRLVSLGFSLFRSKPEDNALKLWDPITGLEIATLVGHAGELTTFQLSPCGRYAVASSELIESVADAPGVIADKKGDLLDALSGPQIPTDLFLWDLEERAKCASLDGCFRPAFSPDGRVVLALSGKGGWLVLWQFASCTTPTTKAFRNGVLGASFTPDGRELALALTNGTLAMVDPATGDERLRLRLSGDKVRSGGFSPDGRHMIDGGASMIRIWDVASGEQVAAFPTQAELKRLRVGPDATRLAMGDKLGGVRLLRVSGIEPGPAIVTAVRIWRFGPHAKWRGRFGFFSRGHKDTEPTAFCRMCESSFVPASTVLDAIEGITRESGLAEGLAPSIALPREAWDEKRLLSSCPNCAASLRFTPFIA
jgi:WD40 repeat protein